MTHPRRDHILQGILVILGSVALLSFGDAIIKLYSANFTLWQIFVLRSAVALPLLALLALVAKRRLRPNSPLWVNLRAVLLLTGWIAYYSALPFLDLAVAAVAVYTNPIITALITATVLRDRVTPAQWLGIGLGFIGVTIILNPGGASFTWALFLPIIGATLYSIAMILTRAKCQDEDFVSLAFALHVSFILAGALGVCVLALFPLPETVQSAAPFLLSGWTSMTLPDWAVMGLLGLLGAGFTLGVARAYQVAPPQIVATFDYAYVGFALIWGVLFFTEQPDTHQLTGMALVVGAGLLVSLGTRRPRLA